MNKRTKKFTEEEKESQRVWREASFMVLDDLKLKVLDEELTSSFNGVGTRRDLFRWLVAGNAASWAGGGEIMVKPLQFEVAMDKLAQWSRWKQRTRPFDLARAHARIAEAKGRFLENGRASTGLLRSKLNEYQSKFGRPYLVPDGTVVLEDVAVPAKKIVMHGTSGASFEYPSEDINPGDIPF